MNVINIIIYHLLLRCKSGECDAVGVWSSRSESDQSHFILLLNTKIASAVKRMAAVLVTRIGIRNESVPKFRFTLARPTLVQ